MLKEWWKKNKLKLAPAQFLAPFLLLYGAFRIYPIVYALILGFHKWNGVGSWKFVGLENYLKVFTDPVALTAIKNTLIMGGGALIISVPIALGLALLINSDNLPGKSFFRAVYFLPRVVAIAVTAIVFSALFHSEYGVINYLLKHLGVIKEAIPWWSNGTWAKVGIIILRSWFGIPFMMIYFLTGLQNIPQELYEAAKIDGAKIHQRFFYITLPLLKPITLFVVITGTVAAFQIFTAPFMITRGGPSNQTLSVIQYMFSRGLNNFKFGLASAVSACLFIFLGMLSFLELKIGSKGGIN